MKGQIETIFDLMKDGIFRTYAEINEATGISEACIAANLRHLRKPKHGSHTVNRVRCSDSNLSKYQLVINHSQEAPLPKFIVENVIFHNDIAKLKDMVPLPLWKRINAYLKNPENPVTYHYVRRGIWERN